MGNVCASPPTDGGVTVDASATVDAGH